jgi:hypothetical protein
MRLTEAKIRQHIAFIREGAATFLIDTAQLYRRTGVEYVEGEARATYAAPVEIQCRLITRSGSQSENIAAQPREVQQNTYTGLYRMQIAYDVDINEGDQITYIDANSSEVKRFDVIFAPAKHAYSAATLIQLQEIK